MAVGAVDLLCTMDRVLERDPIDRQGESLSTDRGG
jgi:hypothetical protein